MEPAITEQLVRQTLAGDKDAFGSLVEAHQQVAFALACQQAPGRADAEDILQEAFLRAYRRLAGLRNPALFPKWLYSIVINVARERRRRHKPTVPIESIPELPGHTVDPAERAALQELLARIANLPPKYRIPLTLRYASGLKYGEIARQLGIGETAARSRVHRARTLLR
ncbi:RNA polymerase sigma factor [Verrucomicrobiota bacterium]